MWITFLSPKHLHPKEPRKVSWGPQRQEGLAPFLIPESGLLFTDGLAVFQAFLRTEFSEENLEFWLACEDFKKVKSQSKMVAKAKKIFAEYIAIQACKEVEYESASLGPLCPCPVAPQRVEVPASLGGAKKGKA